MREPLRQAALHRRVAGRLTTALLVATALTASFCCATTAQAANATWIGATNSAFLTSSNWSPVSTPGAGDTATISNGGLAIQPVLGSDLSVSQVLLSAGGLTANAVLTAASGFTQSGGTLDGTGTIVTDRFTLTGGTVNPGLSISAATALDMRSGTVNGNLLGSGVLTKSGVGTVLLSGANSYSGNTVVSAGVLNVTSGSALGGTAAGTTIASGATLQLASGVTVTGEALAVSGNGAAGGGALRAVSGSNLWTGTVTLGADGRFNTDAGASMAVSGPIGGAKTLAVGGVGTTTLSGVNTFDGLTVDGGTTQLAGSAAVRNDADVTISNAAVVELLGNETIGSLRSSSPGAQMRLGGNTLTLAGDDEAMTFAGQISGAGGMTKTGTDELILAGTSSYGGATQVSGGTFTVRGALTTGSLSNSADLVNDGIMAVSGTVANTGTMSLGSGSSMTVGGTLTGTADGALVRMFYDPHENGVAATRITAADVTTGTKVEVRATQMLSIGHRTLVLLDGGSLVNGDLVVTTYGADGSNDPFLGQGVIVGKTRFNEQWTGIANGDLVVRQTADLAKLAPLFGSLYGAVATAQSSMMEPISTLRKGPDTEEGTGFSVNAWTRSFGGRLDRESEAHDTATHNTRGYTAETGYAGLQIGADAGFHNIAGSGWQAVAGLLMSYNDVNATAGRAEATIALPSIGGYVIATDGRFTVDGMLRADFYRFSVADERDKVHETSVDKMGWSGGLNARYRITPTGGLFVEPSLGLSFARVDLGSVRLDSTTPLMVSYGPVDTVVARAGIAAGTVFSYGGTTTISPSLHARYAQEMRGDTETGYVIGGEGGDDFTGAMTHANDASYPEIGAGADFQTENGKVSGYVRADYRMGQKVDGFVVNGGTRLKF